MLADIKDTLLGKVDAVFMAIERDYTGVVIGLGQGGNTKLLPRDQRLILKKVIQVIGTAESVLGCAVQDLKLILRPSLRLNEPPVRCKAVIGETASDGYYRETGTCVQGQVRHATFGCNSSCPLTFDGTNQSKRPSVAGRCTRIIIAWCLISWTPAGVLQQSRGHLLCTKLI
jgi:hypothetical protein